MKNNEKEQQELIYKFGLYEQQIRQLQQQLEAVEQAILEISSLNFGLDELAGSKEKEVFAPVGKGIFAKTRLISEDLIVDVGGKNFVKKSIPETKELIQNQIKKLEEIKKELEENIEKLGEELTAVFENSQKGHVCDEECEHQH